MSNRLFVPRTNAEAERFLWHAIEHVRTGDHSYDEWQNVHRLLVDLVETFLIDESYGG